MHGSVILLKVRYLLLSASLDYTLESTLARESEQKQLLQTSQRLAGCQLTAMTDGPFIQRERHSMYEV